MRAAIGEALTETPKLQPFPHGMFALLMQVNALHEDVKRTLSLCGSYLRYSSRRNVSGDPVYRDAIGSGDTSIMTKEHEYRVYAGACIELANKATNLGQQAPIGYGGGVARVG